MKRKYNIPAFLVGIIMWVALIWGSSLVANVIVDLIQPPQGGVIIIKALIVLSVFIIVLAPASTKSYMRDAEK